MPTVPSHAPSHDLYDPSFEHDACGIGLLADLKGRASHTLLRDAGIALERMDHRGACGCEANTGDGTGVMTALPLGLLHHLFPSVPDRGRAAIGMVFLPQSEPARVTAAASLEEALREHEIAVLAWRDVPTDPDGADIGPTARASMPHVAMVLCKDEARVRNEADFERRLMVARRKAEKANQGYKGFYVCSLSARTVVYKGMLTPLQLFKFYPDLRDPRFETHFALVHSRFSTNTFPSWERAQPMRMLAHNGEINTLLGNVNSLRAREKVMASERFGDTLDGLFPLVDPDLSDSGAFDRLLELLVRDGRALPDAFARMVPVAWQHDTLLAPEVRSYYEYGACLMEPWDGPAAMVATDGRVVGAVLDRNGLRPCRYIVTADGRVILSSEVGVIDVPPDQIIEKGRLAPGKLFVVDFAEGRILPDDEIKSRLAAQRPYGEWLAANRKTLADFPVAQPVPLPRGEAFVQHLRAFDFSEETIRMMLLPMVREGRDPLGSMGNDEAPAVLSTRPRLLPNYFRQRFAQVTNPPIDSTREACVMALMRYAGPEGNLLEETPEHAARLFLEHPVLDDDGAARLRYVQDGKWRSVLLNATFPEIAGDGALEAALSRLEAEAQHAVRDGASVIVLSDLGTNEDRVPIPMLMAVSTVHHYLVREGLRTKVLLVAETGEARTVHQLCCLIGYGVDAIYPYLAYAALEEARRDGQLDERHPDRASLVKAYRKATGKGILKVMAKMGIATVASYRGAQIFEALGLGDDVIARCFPGTHSRIGGISLADVEAEARKRHENAYTSSRKGLGTLPSNGRFHWRADSTEHAWSPQVIADLQMAARDNATDAYARFAAHLNDMARVNCTLRGLVDFVPGTPIPLDEVESAASIVKRFVTGAMSLGSLSPEAHETMAVAMNRVGGKSNTGEGGEDPIRAIPLENGDSKRSAIKQVASGRFGVTIGYLASADEIQIKMAQGAKPGEGGELPGTKVDGLIARLRHATPGVGLISPPPHHDIYSIEDLKQLIFDLKNANPTARISVKLVSEMGVGTIAAGVAKGFAEHILISGDAGGTGASPLTSIKHAGLPWELGLAETHQTLVRNNLRGRVVVQTDGGLRTGRDMVIAALLGAEEFGFSTAPLISLGCIMMRKCHLNTCPVGVATQDPELRAKFAGKPEHVANYLFMVAEEARAIMAQLGFRTILEMVGRVDRLDTRPAIDHWKSRGIDLSKLLAPAQKPVPDAPVRCVMPQPWELETQLDARLAPEVWPRLVAGEDVALELPLTNLDRSVGTWLSGKIARELHSEGLQKGSLSISFTGTAGQSFGAFLARGITFRLEGDANDYVGKGLSGGIIAVRPPRNARFVAEDSMIAGNVLLYGATSGEAYFCGRVAERFAVRNSGVWAVAEQVGDHGCEYMTGGRVAILGKTGRNFGAGMSGGIAFVRDVDGGFAHRCNLETIDLERVEWPEDVTDLRFLLERHLAETGSVLAQSLLDHWETSIRQFVKVMPRDYRRALDQGLARRERSRVLS